MSRVFVNADSENLYGVLAGVNDYPFTIACLFKLANLDGTQTILSVADDDSTDYHALRATTILFQITFNGSTIQVQGSSVSAGVLYHATAVYEAVDKRYLYMSAGESANNEADSADVTGMDRVAIAVSADSTPFGYADVEIADVAVWNAALTQTEAEIMQDGYSPLFIRPQNLAFYAPLIRDEDIDRIGGVSLSVVGTPDVAVYPPTIYPAPPFLSFAAAAAPPEGIPVPVAWHHLNKNIGR